MKFFSINRVLSNPRGTSYGTMRRTGASSKVKVFYECRRPPRYVVPDIAYHWPQRPQPVKQSPYTYCLSLAMANYKQRRVYRVDDGAGGRKSKHPPCGRCFDDFQSVEPHITRMCGTHEGIISLAGSTTIVAGIQSQARRYWPSVAVPFLICSIRASTSAFTDGVAATALCRASIAFAELPPA